MAKLQLELVTPEKVLLTTTADYVTIPGSLGELGILPGHLPVLTSMDSGVLSYKASGVNHKIAVHYGFAEVHEDKITVLAKIAEHTSDLDMDRARESQRLVADKLKDLDKEDEQLNAKLDAKLVRAATRLQAGRILH